MRYFNGSLNANEIFERVEKIIANEFMPISKEAYNILKTINEDLSIEEIEKLKKLL